MANLNIFRIFGGVSCAAITMLAAVSAPVQQKKPLQIGDYSITNYGDVTFNSNPAGDFEIDITGGGAVPLHFHSADYDIDTRRMTLIAKRVRVQGQRERVKATRITATGNVKVVNRNPQSGQKNIINSNSAVYTATTAPEDRGMVQLTGGVRYEVQGIPSLAGPGVITGDTGTVKFLDDGSLSVAVKQKDNNGTIRVQPNETTPKGKQP